MVCEIAARGESAQGRQGRALSLLKSTLCALALLSCSGCCLPEMIRSTVQPYGNLKFLERLKLRATREARQVWDDRYDRCYPNPPHANDVKKGFVAAYVDAALGFNGCPPPVPTTPLLSVNTISHQSPAAIPWYEGYDLGFAAATANGVRKWRVKPIDPDLAGQPCGSGHSACPCADTTSAIHVDHSVTDLPSYQQAESAETDFMVPADWSDVDRPAGDRLPEPSVEGVESGESL